MSKNNIHFRFKKLNNLFVNRLFSFYIFRKAHIALYLSKTNLRIILLSFNCDKDTDVSNLNKIIEKLEENNIKAKFAIPAIYIKDHLNLIKRILDNNHEIINYTFSCLDHFVELKIEEEQEEIKKADLEIKTRLNYVSRGFRLHILGGFIISQKNY